MKQKLILSCSFIVLLIVGQSCSKDEASPYGRGRRDIKYEISGDYTDVFTVVATTNTDQFEVMEFSKMPWKLEFEANKLVTSVLILATGTNGVAGQKATIKTYVGG
jgi:hypothetical protein